MVFAIAEQTIDMAALGAGDAAHVVALRTRVDPANSAVVHLDVVLEDRSSIDIAFNRNGTMTGATVVPAAQAEEAEAQSGEGETEEATP